MVVLPSVFSSNSRTDFRTGYNRLHFHQHWIRITLLPHPPQHLLKLFFLHENHSDWGEIKSQSNFIFYFLMTKESEHFKYLLPICISSFDICVYSSLAHLLVGWLILGGFNFYNSLDVLNIKSLSDGELAQTFLPPCGLSPDSVHSFLFCVP